MGLVIVAAVFAICCSGVQTRGPPPPRAPLAPLAVAFHGYDAVADAHTMVSKIDCQGESERRVRAKEGV